MRWSVTSRARRQARGAGCDWGGTDLDRRGCGSGCIRSSAGRRRSCRSGGDGDGSVRDGHDGLVGVGDRWDRVVRSAPFIGTGRDVHRHSSLPCAVALEGELADLAFRGLAARDGHEADLSEDTERTGRCRRGKPGQIKPWLLAAGWGQVKESEEVMTGGLRRGPGGLDDAARPSSRSLVWRTEGLRGCSRLGLGRSLGDVHARVVLGRLRAGTDQA